MYLPPYFMMRNK